MRAGHDDPPDIAGTTSGLSGRGMSRQTSGNVVYTRYTRLGDNPTGGISDLSSKEEIGTSKEEIGIEVASALLRRGHPSTNLRRESSETSLLNPVVDGTGEGGGGITRDGARA